MEENNEVKQEIREEVKPVPQQQPKKIRRVGTFAFALVLIAAGVCLLAYSFVPGFDLALVLKLAPVILVVLGVEMLVFAARPGVVLKYDWLSMLACAFILLTVGAASALSPLLGYIGPVHEYVENRMENLYQAQCETALRQDAALTDAVDSVSVFIQMDRRLDATEEAALQTGDVLQLNVTLKQKSVPDRQTFAALCQKITEACTQNGLPVTYYAVGVNYAYSDEILETYRLNSDAAWLNGMSAAQLADCVNVYYAYAGSDYSSKTEALNVKLDSDAQSLYETYQDTFGTDPVSDYCAQNGLANDSEVEGSALNDYMSARLAAVLVTTPETAQ